MRLLQKCRLASLSAFLAGVAAGSALAVAPALAGGAYEMRTRSGPFVVVELYTSQGCSSCPPADQLQVQLAERDDVLALTFPVDYWDYLGWRDTLARPLHGERQMLYAKRSNTGRVYTPQMIIDGVYSEVGSRREDILEKIAESAARPRVAVPITAAADGRVVTLLLGDHRALMAKAEIDRATVYLLPFSAMETVHIGGGENRGRSIRYAHVVRNIVTLGEWTGAPERLTFQLAPRDQDQYAYAVLIQKDEVGPVLGAAWTVRSNANAPPLASPEPPIGGDPLAVNMPR